MKSRSRRSAEETTTSNVVDRPEAAGEERFGVSEYDLSPTFQTSELAAAWCERNLTYGKSVYGLYDAEGNAGNTHIKYRGKLRPILTEIELRSTMHVTGANLSARIMPIDVQWGISRDAHIMPVDVQWGVADSARIMPVNDETTIAWIVIFKKCKRRAFKISEFFGRR
jgi:hypothetical protein